MNYLFVCRMNLNRSAYVAEWARGYCRKNGMEADIRSAGLEVKYVKGWPGLTQVESGMVQRADRIFVMEEWMVNSLVNDYGADRNGVHNLDIPDNFARNERDCMIPTNIISNEIGAFLESGDGFGPYLMNKILEERLAPHLRA